MGDLKLQGQTGAFANEALVKPRKVKEGVSLEQIKQATQGNNLDEMVVKDAKGQRVIAYADELSIKGGQMPKVGDKVNLEFLDDPAVVEHVDNEWNEDYGVILAGPAAPLLMDKGGLKGSDQAILKHTENLAPSKKEIKWAQALQRGITEGNPGGAKPTPLDVSKYENIYQRLQTHKEKQSPEFPADQPTQMPEGKVNQYEFAWAVALEKRVTKGDEIYEPTTQEVRMYQNISERLNKFGPPEDTSAIKK